MTIIQFISAEKYSSHVGFMVMKKWKSRISVVSGLS